MRHTKHVKAGYTIKATRCKDDGSNSADGSFNTLSSAMLWVCEADYGRVTKWDWAGSNNALEWHEGWWTEVDSPCQTRFREVFPDEAS